MSFFGNNVRRIRKERKWNLEDLALKVGFKSSKLADIETGKKTATVGDAVKIAVALDSPVLIAARCRECEIRVKGFQAFYPDINISAYAELMDVYNQIKKQVDEIKAKIKIVDDLKADSDSYKEQFVELRDLFKQLSYITYTASSLAEMMIFVKE